MAFLSQREKNERDWRIVKGEIPDDEAPVKIIPRVEVFTQANVTYSQLIEFLYGEYKDKTGGLAGAEGSSFEKELLRELKERATGKAEKKTRTHITNHHQSGQISMYGFLTNPVEPAKTITASTGLIKDITSQDICKRMRTQLEVKVPVYSARGNPAGTFSRRFDLLTSRGIYDVKLGSIKDPSRLLVEFTTMAILWVAKRRSHRVFDISARWRTTFAPKMTEANSFGKISPNIKPILGIISPDGLVTAKSISFDIKKARSTQTDLNRALLTLLEQK